LHGDQCNHRKQSQQQPDFLLSPAPLASARLSPACPAGAASLGNFRAIATNNSFTFDAVLADVSMKNIPDSSAYPCAICIEATNLSQTPGIRHLSVRRETLRYMTSRNDDALSYQLCA
jgi:hypothetical protein